MGSALDTIEPEARDWRLSFGMLLTVAWVALGMLYIANVVGWLDFARQPAPDLGGFLEGAFAPLAFLWLVIGFFLQQRQLSENTVAIRGQYEALQRSAEQAEVQSRAIAANEQHARQDTFMEVARMVGNQLGVISGYQWMSSQGTETADEAISTLWTQIGQGDHTTFSRLLISLSYLGGEPRDLFWSTEVRTRHSENFLRVFERLLVAANECDTTGMMAEAIGADAHGRLYEMIRESRPAPVAS